MMCEAKRWKIRVSEKQRRELSDSEKSGKCVNDRDGVNILIVHCEVGRYVHKLILTAWLWTKKSHGERERDTTRER